MFIYDMKLKIVSLILMILYSLIIVGCSELQNQSNNKSPFELKLTSVKNSGEDTKLNY